MPGFSYKVRLEKLVVFSLEQESGREFDADTHNHDGYREGDRVCFHYKMTQRSGDTNLK